MLHYFTELIISYATVGCVFLLWLHKLQIYDKSVIMSASVQRKRASRRTERSTVTFKQALLLAGTA